jgi:deazaflavin-dependent oxidoreductase (nitroreductase family)
MKFATSAHAGVYRASGGKLGGSMGKSPVLLLNTVGRKTGVERTTPLLYAMDSEDYAIVASYGGAPKHPDWFLNLQANPETSIEVGGRKINVRAEVATSEDKPRLWAKLTEMYPTYDDYQKKTEREIPVIILHPRD